MIFMKTILLLISILFFVQDSNAQLISWKDIIEADQPVADERIYYGSDSLQFGDLWIPEHKNPRATVILIHGGCWLSAYPGVDLMHLMANSLKENGFVVWNIEYRRLGHAGGGYPGTFTDIADAADFLSVIGPQFNLPQSQTIAAGHSAGGHLATWLSVRANIPEESPLFSADPLRIDGVISLAGINDLERYARYGSSSCGADTVPRLVNSDNRDHSYQDTSPAELLPVPVPIIEVNAAFDAPVPPFFGYHFTEAAKQSGSRAQQVLLTKTGHFEMIYPMSSEWGTILELFNTILD